MALIQTERRRKCLVREKLILDIMTAIYPIEISIFKPFLYKKQKKHALWCEIGFKQIFTIGGGSESA